MTALLVEPFNAPSEGLELFYASSSTPAGPLVVLFDKEGTLWASGFDSAEETALMLGGPLPLLKPSALPAQVSSFLDGYLNGEPLPEVVFNDELSYPSSLKEAVSFALTKVPVSQTVTYTTLAELAGSPKAIRPVASACASNRVALFIPCHRVIPVSSTWDLGRYRWGSERKAALLYHERQVSSLS
jgi:O-6-methylguanine DNA methyltransferase